MARPRLSPLRWYARLARLLNHVHKSHTVVGDRRYEQRNHPDQIVSLANDLLDLNDGDG
jgi:hypothetical protein